MSYTQLEIDVLFDELFELYPSKEKESSARKAFSVALRSGEDHKRIKQAIQIYALESQGDTYHYYFYNFLNEHHWKDFIDAHKNVDEYLRGLQQQHDDAVEVIKEWNRKCRPHWCQALDIEARVPMVKKSLRDESFKKHWRKSLDIAHKIFYKELHESHKYGRVTLTLKWFVSIEPEKHTVLRLREGEYGSASDYIIKRRKTDPPRTKEETEEALRLWNEVFNNDEPEDNLDFE